MDQTISRENLDAFASPDEKIVICKFFIRPWEEITHNKHIIGFGYNKHIRDVSFHLLDFPKHCNRVGHVKYRCFDLHLYEHYGKCNHSFKKCSIKKNTTREKLNFGRFLLGIGRKQPRIFIGDTQDILESVDQPCSDK